MRHSLGVTLEQRLAAQRGGAPGVRVAPKPMRTFQFDPSAGTKPGAAARSKLEFLEDQLLSARDVVTILEAELERAEVRWAELLEDAEAKITRLEAEITQLETDVEGIGSFVAARQAQVDAANATIVITESGPQVGQAPAGLLAALENQTRVWNAAKQRLSNAETALALAKAAAAKVPAAVKKERSALDAKIRSAKKVVAELESKIKAEQVRGAASADAKEKSRQDQRDREFMEQQSAMTDGGGEDKPFPWTWVGDGGGEDKPFPWTWVGVGAVGLVALLLVVRK